MNDRQRRFAELVVQGLPAGRAYEQAGYDARGKSADEEASRLSRNVKVSDHIEKLRSCSQEEAVWALNERKKMLKDIALQNREVAPRVAIQAADQYNKLEGDYAPEKRSITTGVTALDALFANLDSNAGLHNETNYTNE